jgi:hypothetical protein
MSDDPCLWTMCDEMVTHMIFIGVYVDDFLITRKEESIGSLIDELENHEINLKIKRNCTIIS